MRQATQSSCNISLTWPTADHQDKGCHLVRLALPITHFVWLLPAAKLCSTQRQRAT